jgi:hypothetical protein
LDRIYREQLHNLLVAQHIFHQFADCTKPHIGQYTAAELAEWMRQGYIAFAVTAIRRMVEEPKSNPKWKSLSLVILLRDLARHSSLLTIERYRQLFRKSVVARFADRWFADFTGNQKATTMPVRRINRDIRELKRVSEPVQRLANKVIAHTELDRRRLGQLTYQRLDDAIDLLAKTYETYRKLITANCPPVLLSHYDVTEHFRKIWP